MSSPVSLASGITVFCRHEILADLTSLKPFPKNPNTHSPEQLRLLAKIIKSNGWRNPIVVSLRSGFITKGHGRLGAARLLMAETGEALVPVEYQEYESDAAELEDIIADNRISELSALDAGLVGELLSDVRVSLGDGFDAELFGFKESDFGMPTAEWGAPGAESSNPTRHGQTDESGKATIRIQCPQADINDVKAKLREAIKGLEGVELV